MCYSISINGIHFLRGKMSCSISLNYSIKMFKLWFIYHNFSPNHSLIKIIFFSVCIYICKIYFSKRLKPKTLQLKTLLRRVLSCKKRNYLKEDQTFQVSLSGCWDWLQERLSQVGQANIVTDGFQIWKSIQILESIST